jgi:hypothetical protein
MAQTGTTTITFYKGPLCALPTYSRYRGTGSLDDGANVKCAAPADSPVR